MKGRVQKSGMGDYKEKLAENKNVALNIKIKGQVILHSGLLSDLHYR